MLLKVFIGVWRCQVSFETMFWLIWVKNWAVEAQKVLPADSTPTPPVDWPKSPAWLGLKIVFCWNNCSGYSQEKCFKCNLVFPKLSRLKKGQRVKGFWSQGRKKGTEGKVFEAEAVGRGWEMFPEVPFFLPRLQNVYELPFFFQPRCLGINQITREPFSP